MPANHESWQKLYADAGCYFRFAGLDSINTPMDAIVGGVGLTATIVAPVVLIIGGAPCSDCPPESMRPCPLEWCEFNAA